MSFVVTKVCLSQQNFCYDKTFVAQQTYFCRDKRTFVMTKDTFCHDKNMLVRTKLCLLWQMFGDKHNFIMTKTSIFLWQQDTFCHDKHVFLTTKLLIFKVVCRDHLTQLLPFAWDFIVKKANGWSGAKWVNKFVKSWNQMPILVWLLL